MMNVNSYFIKQEINRFECVHPCIYAAYDILDQMKDEELSNKIRDHLITIEDAFVNSEEWTLSRSVSEIRLGFVGSNSSGKSALIHYFLTGFYINEESPEGGRFKKLIFSQGQPYLLLIRDEASAPDLQLANWVDALIFVVSLTNLESVQLANDYLTLFCNLRDSASLPIMLVATQDTALNTCTEAAIETQIRQLMARMHWCPYYETCAIYGMNVDFIFQDIVSHVLKARLPENFQSLEQQTPFPNMDNTSVPVNNCEISFAQDRSSRSRNSPQYQNPPLDHLVPNLAQQQPNSFVVNRLSGTVPLNESDNSPWNVRPSSLIDHPFTSNTQIRTIGPSNSFALQAPFLIPPYLVGAGQTVGRQPVMQIHQSYPQVYQTQSTNSFTLQPTVPMNRTGQANIAHLNRPSSNDLLPLTNMSALNNRFALLNMDGQPSSVPHSVVPINMILEYQQQYSQSPLLDMQRPSNKYIPNMTGDLLMGIQLQNHPPLVNPLYNNKSNDTGPQFQISPLDKSRTNMKNDSQVNRMAHVNICGVGIATVTTTITTATTTVTGTLVTNNQKSSSPKHRQNNSDESKRDRPRPQSTGSLVGPLSSLNSGTLDSSNLCNGILNNQIPPNYGAGRLIPLKQGYLYKRSTKGLSKETWKKKYVVLTEDARLTYHPSKQDYVNGQHSKSIDLRISTVKLPGLAYRMGALPNSNNPNSDITQSTHISSSNIEGISNTSVLSSSISNAASSTPKHSRPSDDKQINMLSLSPESSTSQNLTTSETDNSSFTKTHNQNLPGSDIVPPHNQSVVLANKKSTNTNPISGGGRILKEAMKRQYKRAKAAVTDISTDVEPHDFIIVTANNVHWHFEAPSATVRDEWIQQIEALIHHCLRSGPTVGSDQTDSTNPSRLIQNSDLTQVNNPKGVIRKTVGRPLSFTFTHVGDVKEGGGEDVCGHEEVLKRLTALPGNDLCADCGAPNPEWASLNLGVLICIECSGVHRELGTHISRVRSATLDTWSREHLAVMASFGNTIANSVWEGAAPSQAKQYKKPDPSSTRDVRTTWIHHKYVRRLFLPPLPQTNRPLQQELADAIVRNDARSLLLCIAVASMISTTSGKNMNPINAMYSLDDSRTALHIAATLGDMAAIQLLIWHGADVNVTDQMGFNAWSYAFASKHDACARLLQSHGCRVMNPVMTQSNLGSFTPFPTKSLIIDHTSTGLIQSNSNQAVSPSSCSVSSGSEASSYSSSSSCESAHANLSPEHPL